MKYDVPHLLVITHIPGDEEYDAEVEFEIFHPHACEEKTWESPEKFGEAFCFEDERDLTYTYFDCWTGTDISHVGLDGLAWGFDIDGYVQPENWDEEWTGLPEGAYLIRSWGEYSSYLGEWDGGLELIGLAPQPLTAAEWQGLDDRLEV